MKLKGLMFAMAALVTLTGSAYPAREKVFQSKSETTTLENLQTDFRGESNAKASYEVFAAKADLEGYLGVAGLFRAAALSESILAAKHAKAIEALGGKPKADLEKPIVNSTKENLQEAKKMENRAGKKVYPAFLAKASQDKNQKAIYCFKAEMGAEAMHLQMFSQALTNMNEWKAAKKFLVCQTCGYTTMDLNIKACPVCSQPRSQFTEVQ